MVSHVEDTIHLVTAIPTALAFASSPRHWKAQCRISEEYAMPRIELPARRGGKPRTTPFSPQFQLTQFGTAEVRASMLDWMSAERPGVATGPTQIAHIMEVQAYMEANHPEIELPEEIPGGTGIALFLDGRRPPAGVRLLPPRFDAEFAHVHPDGSLHMVVPLAVEREILAKGWGERHPFHDPSMRLMMLYAPRDMNELAVARSLVDASYRYASGRDTAD
jgi:hypothetical protein